MYQNSTHMPHEADDMAEGSPHAYESREPETSADYSSYATLIGDSGKAKTAAETGLITAVNLSGESKDDNDIQDSDLTSGETQSDPVAETQTKTEIDNSTIKVLIVEDTTELAEIIQATLERMSYQTWHETHGNKALERFNELNPEVVLLDISLPDMTGWKIMDAIKERLEATEGKMPIVIVITAYDDPANRLVGKLQGIHSYLIKPFTSDEIEKAVSQALSGATS